MNLSGIDRALEQADEAVNTNAGGTRQSERSFLQQLVQHLGGSLLTLVQSPAELLRVVLKHALSLSDAESPIEVLAMPSQRPQRALRAGDWMVRLTPGTRDVGHLSVLASGDLHTPATLAAENIPAESSQPGEYGLVIEAGAFPHRRSRPFARRVLDRRGRVPRNTVLLRPRYSDTGSTPLPLSEPDLETPDPEWITPEWTESLHESSWEAAAPLIVDEATTEGLSILVVDENGQPVHDGKFAIHQSGRSETGDLATSKGLAVFKNIDRAQPFVFEVLDRVCAIAGGAFIDPDNAALEYGGTWFDWTLVRDNKNPDVAFWPYYLSELKLAASRRGVDRFWQHEHITRRPIRAAGAATNTGRQVKICAVPPQIRTGPIVRYTDHRSATIWLEAATPCMVKLRVKRSGGAEAEKTAHASTVRVGGRHFAFVEIGDLAEETIYQYTLELAPLPAKVIPVDPGDFAGVFPSITAGVRKELKRQLDGASVEPNLEWLTFRTLRQKYDKSMRFATGSCRWYPGDGIRNEKGEPRELGPDMLDKLGEWLRKTPRTQWPHFQFYGGDQVYADEIGEQHHKELIRARFSSRLPGPADAGTAVSDRLVDGAWAGRFAHRLERFNAPSPTFRRMVDTGLSTMTKIYEAAPLLRSFTNHRVTEQELKSHYETLVTRREVQGRKQSRPEDEQRAKNAVDLLPRLRAILISSEPFRVYRPYWDTFAAVTNSNRQSFLYRSCNFLLWQLPNAEADLPTLQDQSKKESGVVDKSNHGQPSADYGKHVADFAEYSFLYERAWTTSENVRTLLGNVPTFLMFDDHEVTDDWGFDVAWVRMLHSRLDHYRMWPKTLTDALCAYWMYQGMGNKAPSQWQGDPRADILKAAQRAGTDALPELRKCIYRAVMASSPGTSGTAFQTGLNLNWHYRLPFEPPFLVPDCRSRKRMAPGDDEMRVVDHKKNPPQGETIDSAQIQWMRDALSKCKHPVAFIAPSTPLLLQEKLMDFMTKPEVAARAWAGEVDVASAFAAFFSSTKLGMATSQLIRIFRREKDLEHMVRDKSWRDLWGLAEALRRDRSPIKTLALVSGDVHHSYCMTGHLTSTGRAFPEFLQITSSGQRTTIRKGTKEGVAGWQSSFAFNLGERHMKPGFMSKAGSRQRHIALYQNAIALVDVALGAEVEVRVIHFAGDDETKAVEQYVYEYTSAASYIRNGEPRNTPWRVGEGIEAVANYPIEQNSSFEPGQSIKVDNQLLRTAGDGVAWYTKRRDVLLEQVNAFKKERSPVPDGLADLAAAADARIKSLGKLGSQLLNDTQVTGILGWFDRYLVVLEASDRAMEAIVLDRIQAVREMTEKYKAQAAQLIPRLRDFQRSAFRAGKTNKLKETAETLATILDSLLVADGWIREAATTMQEIRDLGNTLWLTKGKIAPHPWHELTKAATNARLARVLNAANRLNKVLAAWQLVDSGITLVAGGKTDSDRTSAGISFATTLASAGGTLLGAAGFFSLYNNLYMGPMVKRILGQIDQLKDVISTGKNRPYIEAGMLDYVNWDIEPGGKDMYLYMRGVMDASEPGQVKPIPQSVAKYFHRQRKDFDAGTRKPGETRSYGNFDDKRFWAYHFRQDIWGMLYGSMSARYAKAA